MQIISRFIPCLILHNYQTITYKSEKSGGWVGMVGGGGNIAWGVKQDIAQKWCLQSSRNIESHHFSTK